MKNLIVFFFVLTTVVVNAQDSKSEVFAENVKPAKTIAKSKKIIVLAEPIKLAALQNVKSGISDGFSKGDAQLLSTYFPSNIDISILGKSNLYSNSQAKQVLTTFFTQHKVSSFSITHEGNSGGTKYFVGNYVSGASKYRITINVKSSAGSDQITGITIEN